MAAAARAVQLSAREREVLALLLEGQTYQQVADRLRIRKSTVNGHVRAIAERLPGPGRPFWRILRHGPRLLAE